MTELPPTNKQIDRRRLVKYPLLLSLCLFVIAWVLAFTLSAKVHYGTSYFSNWLQEQLRQEWPFFLFTFLFVLAFPVAGFFIWRSKWKVIEEPRRRNYANLYRKKESLYQTLLQTGKDTEDRRLLLTKEQIRLTAEEEKFKQDFSPGGNFAIIKHVEWEHVLAEFTDAKALISKELAAIERLTRPAEEPRVVVAPAPVASHQLSEETGLERY